MPGKSKRKQQRYATKRQSMAGRAPAITNTTTAPPVTKTGTVFTGKTPTPVKGAAPGSKAAAAQYTPDLLKHVGTELKITLALSGFIVAVIIVLAFILH